MISTTLVTGASSAEREAAIAASLDRQMPTAVILEGLPDGKSELPCGSDEALLKVVRIAPGCICCTGSLTMRVTLNRVLRHPPQRLFISLANATHLPDIRKFLSTPPYDRLLMLTHDINMPS
jgi:G3E family GTPase